MGVEELGEGELLYNLEQGGRRGEGGKGVREGGEGGRERERERERERGREGG